ncbi:hypothetical protein [Patulibacter sp. SYSU D01012]|uniref:hypothetical protein n=1 Tax=Patulibacter sp. SYSU D01012 TaxID=2817381 RepID=UPI001B30AADC|nr:hypothetical protein [Patulibacter sp. SYSU D01012]
MRASLTVPALAALVLAAAAGPAGAQTPPALRDLPIAVTPAATTAATSITASWTRPAAPTRDDDWQLCPTSGDPCRTGTSTSGAVTLDDLAEGRYRLRVSTEDADGVSAGGRDVVVDRTAPTRPTITNNVALPPGTPYIRFAVVEEGEQLAPIVRAHWVRCMDVPLPGQPKCVEGSSAPDDVVVPVDPLRPGVCGWASGLWSVAVWLEDAAGNADRTQAAASSLVLPAASCPAPIPPRTSPRLRVAGTLTQDGTRRRAAVTVELAPGVSGDVSLRVTPRRGRTTWKVRRATRTIRDGRVTWSVRVPARTTRVSVEARYGGNARFVAKTKRTGVRLSR